MKILKISRIAILIYALMSLFPAANAIEHGKLRVGASKIDISPPSDMFPMKNMQTFSGVHDPIFVRSLVIDNGIVKAALVTFDLVGVPGGDDLVKTIGAELGIKPEHLYLTATHDHNTPMVRDPRFAATQTSDQTTQNNLNAYFETIKKSTIRAVKEADSRLQPARVGFATGKAYVNVNRDQKLGEGYHMGYNPDGPSDKTVAVVSFTNLSGEPIAIYSNYPVHAVVMFRVKSKDGMPEITGDIAGATSAYVERHFKNAVALWTSGAAGDQNPLFMANYNQDGPDVYDECVAGYAILDILSRRLGEEIVRLTESIKNTSADVSLWGKQTTVTCPGQKRETPPVQGVPAQGYLAPAHIKMIDGDPVTIPLSLLIINDIALAGVSGEAFTEIGEHLKAQSPFDRTIVVTHLPNGVGYIPTDAGFNMPSEKAIQNRLKPGCAEPAIINAFVDIMNKYLSGDAQK